MTSPLDGAVAIVTGSAMNIGRENCRQLAEMSGRVVSHAVSNRAAAEFAADKVTANIVVPGLIDTVRGAAAGKIPRGGHPNLLERDGTPAEVVHVVTSLCHPTLPTPSAKPST